MSGLVQTSSGQGEGLAHGATQASGPAVADEVEAALLARRSVASEAGRVGKGRLKYLDGPHPRSSLAVTAVQLV